jgi:hypothetical protein
VQLHEHDVALQVPVVMKSMDDRIERVPVVIESIHDRPE